MKAVHYAIILIVAIFLLHHRDNMNSDPKGYNLEKFENFPNTASDPFVQKEMHRFPPRDPCRLNDLQFNCFDENNKKYSDIGMSVCSKPVDNKCSDGNYLMGRSNGTPRKCRSIV